MELWDTILSCIEKRISHQNYEIWFRPTILDRQDAQGKTLFVRVPNKHFKYWLAENYSEIIHESLQEAQLGEYTVAFLVNDLESESLGPAGGGFSEGLKKPCEDAFAYRLNLKYTFHSFVVGLCNQLAHAAALAVAEQPSKAYNPLFLYGGVGLGKTHLMHAIGHCIKTHRPRTRLVYLSSERFMNELINAIRYERTIQFRDKYRNIDVLLMDDIQFLAGKERTQEEFFHTFNDLYDAQKQIVISSDSPPREIPTLEERLHSRFEWGLIADIQPPDLETKVAILRKKAELEGIEIPDDVIFFVASHIKSNVRELEGSLVRLVAYSSLTGEPIRLSMAQRVLRNIMETQSKLISIESIQRVVADHFQLKPADLRAKSNSRRVAEPRQIAMYLCKEHTAQSLPQIGREFGGKHHTTVLHSVRKVKKLRATDQKLDATLTKLASLIV